MTTKRPLTKIGDEAEREMADAEYTRYTADQEWNDAVDAAAKLDGQAHATTLRSLKTKLTKLGFTDDEVAYLTGRS